MPDAHVIGDKALAKIFKQLPGRIFRKVARASVSKALTPVTKSAKRRVRVQTGLLKKSIGKKVKTYSRSQNIAGIVGARNEIEGEFKGKKRKPAKYSHLVERTHPFLRPAFDENQKQMIETLSKDLAAGAIREAQKIK